MEPISLRAATPADYPAIGAISTFSYPGFPDGIEARADRYRTLDGLYPLERFVAERAGRHVGQYCTFHYELFLGGVASRAGGLAGIAVAPEARRTGVASAIVRHHFDRQRETSVPWSLLYPFSPRFYSAHGWGAAASRVRWRFRPADLPLFPERSLIEPMSISRQGALELLQRAYERWCARVNGSIARTAAQLKWHFGADRVLAFAMRRPDGQLGGYLFGHARAAGARPQVLVIPEFIATDDTARRALYGFLAAQSDQYDWIELDTPLGDPIGALLDRSMAEREDDTMPEEHHPIATIYSGLMARVVDLRRALAARGYSPGARGRLAFATVDPYAPENEAPTTLALDAGLPEVTAGRAAATPLVTGPIAAISQVLVGAMDLADATRLGRLSIDPPEAALDAGALLSLPPPYPLVVF